MEDTAGVSRDLPTSINNNKQNQIAGVEETDMLNSGQGCLFRLIGDLAGIGIWAGAVVYLDFALRISRYGTVAS
jgi:hypothetical protein